jgi:hypothetical protein
MVGKYNKLEFKQYVTDICQELIDDGFRIIVALDWQFVPHQEGVKSMFRNEIVFVYNIERWNSSYFSDDIKDYVLRLIDWLKTIGINNTNIWRINEKDYEWRNIDIELNTLVESVALEF